MLVLREAVTTGILIAALIVGLGILGVEVYEHISGKEVYPSDNPAEEMAETMIEAQTGIDVDLSPMSKE